MIGKKGIGWSHLLEIILIIVVAIVLIGGAQQLLGILKKGSDVETCRLSVLAQAQTKVGGSSFVPLKCERRKVELFNDKIEINDKKEAKYEFDKLDENVVNKAVAEELRLCWYMMGEGKVNVFEQGPALETDKVCAICSEISFNKEVIKSKGFDGLTDFLKGNKIPEQDTYYYDYLVTSQRKVVELLGGFIYTPWFGYESTTRIGEETIESDKDYIAYFYAFKSSWLNEKASTILGTDSMLYYIGFGTPQKVTRECRRLVN